MCPIPHNPVKGEFLRAFLTILLLILPCSTDLLAAKPRKGKAKDLAPEFKAAAEKVAVAANKLQDVWARVLGSKLPKGCRLVKIKCDNAVMGAPMFIEFILLPDDVLSNITVRIPL